MEQSSAIYQAESAEKARRRLAAFADTWRARIPKAVAYLLNLHKRASDQAAASQVNLDRIQCFFIAITVSSPLKEETRSEESSKAGKEK